MDELNGIVVVNKTKGYTSHDVVSVLRKILGTRKIGHTGTLDPNAEGVLPVCVGKSTKACDMLTFSDKEYVAEVKLGMTTDTYDIWGDITSQKTVDVSEDSLRCVIDGFVGDIEQIPPMYSAIKQNGKKLYELARQGVEVELKPRPVSIYECELLAFSGDTFSIRVSCSKGTYIRSLCHDIGKKLGCGACMSALIRTKSSVFSIGEAVTLEEIRKQAEECGASSVLECVDRVFMGYPSLKVNAVVKQRLLNGAYSRVSYDLGTYRVYDDDGFVGIAEVMVGQKGNVIKIIKAF